MFPDDFIRSTDFGRLADQIHDPSSPVEFLIHVPNEAVLREVSKSVLLAHGKAAKGEDVNLMAVFDGLFKAGSARVSHSHGFRQMDSSFVVNDRRVPRLALCKFCCLPPFHIVHTPGLFEGTLIKPQQAPKQSSGRRMRS
ncbi:MAG: hypothetical protein H7A46_16940 [Verrucomicrobiales bacterium]|nr:hypothetical protein [Verrucomicrobiales bacterium]